MFVVIVRDRKKGPSVTRWKTEAMASEYLAYIRPTLLSHQTAIIKRTI